MKRTLFGVAALAVVLPALCWGQSAPPAKEKTSPIASAKAAAKDVAADLREARELVKKINDKKLRTRLELLLARSELKTLDIQKNLTVLASLPKRVPVSADELAKFVKGLKANAFDTEKAAFVETNAKTRWFTSAQARDILKLFAFDDGRVKAGVALYPRVSDPENWFVVDEAFTFDGGRKALREKLKIK